MRFLISNRMRFCNSGVLTFPDFLSGALSSNPISDHQCYFPTSPYKLAEKRLYRSDSLIDIPLRFLANKLTLSLASPVFKSMFVNWTKEEDGLTAIQLTEDVGASVFAVFLDYIYSHRIELNRTNIFELLVLADKWVETFLALAESFRYDIKILVDTITNVLKNYFTLETVPPWHDLALTLGLKGYHRTISVLTNRRLCSGIESWTCRTPINFLIKSKPKFSIDLWKNVLSRDDITVPNEFWLFMMIIRKLPKEFQERLISVTRFSKMRPCELLRVEGHQFPLVDKASLYQSYRDHALPDYLKHLKKDNTNTRKYSEKFYHVFPVKLETKDLLQALPGQPPVQPCYFGESPIGEHVSIEVCPNGDKRPEFGPGKVGIYVYDVRPPPNRTFEVRVTLLNQKYLKHDKNRIIVWDNTRALGKGYGPSDILTTQEFCDPEAGWVINNLALVEITVWDATADTPRTP